jgi:NADPH-dependent curcumin reductase CurA
VAWKNRKVVLASRPDGYPKPANFELLEEDIDGPRHGEVVVESRWLSLDPYQRGRMSQTASYAPPLEIGETMPGGVVGRVVATESPALSIGDWVEGLLGWQEFHRGPASSLRRLDPTMAPPRAALGVLGIPGLTAWFGLTEIGRPRPGDTVVVSAASGAVGQVVGQLAKMSGCRVIGIAGSVDKLEYLTGELGFDAAVSRREENFAATLREACPAGVDVYFDNVGGPVSEAVFANLATRARVVVCGRISQVNLSQSDGAPRNDQFLIVKEACMEGFLLQRFGPHFDAARARLSQLIAADAIRYREDITEGIERAPEAFIGMLSGQNRGKALVRLGGG